MEDLFYTFFGLIIFLYPVNKIVRYLLSKGNVSVITKAWMTCVIILTLHVANLALISGEGKVWDVQHKITYSLPSYVFFLIIDILRKNEDALFFKATRNRIFRWVTACLSFFMLIIMFPPLILGFTGYNDVYYIGSLCLTIIYLYIFLRKPRKIENNQVHISYLDSDSSIRRTE